VTPYSLLEIYRRFGGTYCLQFGSSCGATLPSAKQNNTTGRTTSEWRRSRGCNTVRNTAHRSKHLSALRRAAPPQSTTISAYHNYDVIKCSRHCCDITSTSDRTPPSASCIHRQFPTRTTSSTQQPQLHVPTHTTCYVSGHFPRGASIHIL